MKLCCCTLLLPISILAITDELSTVASDPVFWVQIATAVVYTATKYNLHKAQPLTYLNRPLHKLHIDAASAPTVATTDYCTNYLTGQPFELALVLFIPFSSVSALILVLTIPNLCWWCFSGCNCCNSFCNHD